jgi:hypothetical protein
MIIILDFDGTCVTHEFPDIGKDIGAVPVLKKLIAKGHKLVLFTMRSNVYNPKSNDPDILDELDNYLDHAINWFIKHDIPLYGIQTNPTQYSWTTSPKAYGHLIIDDTALGCPLKTDLSISPRPFIDWQRVEEMLYKQCIL